MEDLARGEGDFGLGISQFGAIQFDAPLGDEAAGFRIAGDSFRFLDEFGEGEGGGGWAKGLDFSRREIFFGELGFEVGAGGGGGSFSMKFSDNGGGELFFGFHGVGRRLIGEREEGAKKIAPRGAGFVGNRHHFAENFLGRFGNADVVAEGFAHFLFAVGAGKKGGDEDDLGFLACLALKVATDEVVEELIVSAEFDIGADGDGVVALKNGVLKFGEADGDTLFVAFGEVVSFEHAGDIDLAVEAKEIEASELGEPFSVAADFGFLGIEDFEDLVGVGFGVLFDGFGIEGWPGFGAPGGIADAGGIIADDDDGEMASVLELADFGEDESVAEVKVGGGGIEAKFDAEGATRGEFFGKLFSGMDVGEARKKSIGGHGVSLIGMRAEVKAIRWIFHNSVGLLINQRGATNL